MTSTAFGWRPEWTARALALFRGEDDRFTDEEILTILRAGEAGLKIPDVCAAGGIRMATYYAWKAKYAGLTPSGVRNRRLRDRRKRQTTMAAFGVLGVICVGAAGMFVTTRNASEPPSAASQPPNASANALENSLESPPAPPAATVTIPAAAPETQSAAAAGGALPSTAVRPPSQGAAAESAGLRAGAPWANAEDIETADPNDYVVQVAAVPDLREARAVRDQLAEAGYHAYLTAAVIDQVELYRVRVGPLKSRNEAQDIARRLEREGHRAPWVTK